VAKLALSSDVLRAMKDTLLSGRYSLLIGAGASYDSEGPKGVHLPLGDQLRKDLVALKKLRASSSLARAYGVLSRIEVDTHITDRFAGCRPGPTVLKIPAFNWHRTIR
jgi:hypothetical protein